MKTTKPTLKPRVQYYDRVEMKNYYEHKHAFIFGWEEIVHQEKIGSTATLDIQAETMPEKVLFNGKEFILTPK